MKKTIKYTLYALAFLVAAALAVFVGSHIGTALYCAEYFRDLPAYSEPVPKQKTTCILCRQSPSNAPCLINLNTGEIGEIILYDADPSNPTEIDASVTEYGTMRIYSAAGATCYGNPDNHYTQINIYHDDLFQYSSMHARLYFCDNCMAMVNETEPGCNFLLADCYNKNNVSVYKLEDARKPIQIRHYTINITEMYDDRFSLKMKSSFFES